MGVDRDPDTLLAEAVRLFAEHHARAQENQRRAVERDRTMQAARTRQIQAHTAHIAAFNEWDVAIEARRQDPGNLALLAEADRAEADYQVACAEAERVNQEVEAVFSQAFDESHVDTEALLELGRRARAVQDAWFVATMPQQPRPAARAATLKD